MSWQREVRQNFSWHDGSRCAAVRPGSAARSALLRTFPRCFCLWDRTGDPGLEDDSENHPERDSQDRHVPERSAGPVRRGWRALSVHMQRWWVWGLHGHFSLVLCQLRLFCLKEFKTHKIMRELKPGCRVTSTKFSLVQSNNFCKPKNNLRLFAESNTFVSPDTVW